MLDFCRQQPLGAVSFVIIFLMMFAGIFSPLVAPYDPLDDRFRLDPGRAVLASTGAAPTPTAATSARG